jgi:hypothetical protein
LRRFLVIVSWMWLGEAGIVIMGIKVGSGGGVSLDVVPVGCAIGKILKGCGLFVLSLGRVVWGVFG